MFIPEILTAFVIEKLIGHPENRFHPVRGIGWLISRCENFLRLDLVAEKQNYLRGGALWLIVISVVCLAAWLIIEISSVTAATQFIAITAIIYFSFAVKELGGLALECESLVDNGRISEARSKLKGLVGRDTSELNDDGVKKAAIESVAENMTDSFIAPLFYAAIFGPIGALAYRAVNTIDSMCGYKSDRYREFGYVGAKLDDAFNYLPARISGLVLLMAALPARRFRVTMKALFGARGHASPNAWVPEVAFANILDIKLGGTAYYEGRLVERPVVGPAMGPDPRPISVRSAVDLLSFASYIYLVLIGVLAIFWQLFLLPLSRSAS